jgi:hypothetical protein
MTTPGDSKIFGISLDGGAKPRDSLEVKPDTSVWEIYNYHAEQVDSEVVNSCTDTLTTLLIFVSL